MNFVYLGLAIVAEVAATSFLTASQAFTRLWPSLATVVLYALAFYLLSLPIRVFPVGVVYAIWSGVGIVLIAGVAWLWFGQALDWPAVVGLTLIIAGVLVVNLFSKTVAH